MEFQNVKSTTLNNKNKTTLFTKAQYGFCIISTTFFIGRCIASLIFNI